VEKYMMFRIAIRNVENILIPGENMEKRDMFLPFKKLKF
jgi:hypothetical protein